MGFDRSQAITHIQPVETKPGAWKTLSDNSKLSLVAGRTFKGVAAITLGLTALAGAPVAGVGLAALACIYATGAMVQSMGLSERENKLIAASGVERSPVSVAGALGEIAKNTVRAFNPFS